MTSLSIPKAVSGHNNYWLWGPRELSGEVMLVLSHSEEWLHRHWGDVSRVRQIDCRWCLPAVDRLAL